MSIKKKLTITMIGICVTAVVLTVSTIIIYLIYDMRESKAQELGVAASITGDRNKAALMFADTTNGYKNLDIFRLDESIIAACIYDAQGNLFANYHNPSAYADYCLPKLAHDMRAKSGHLLAMKNIMHNGEVLGNVILVSDTRDISAFINKIVLISAVATGLVLLAAFMSIMYFRRTICAPILELAATAERITSSKDYSLEATHNYRDETGILANAFNAMLREVRRRDEELTKANETLEHKVTIRTHQLQEQTHRAEAANAAKSEFLRNMSHEFRTPLHALISFSAYGIKEAQSSSRDQFTKYFQFIQTGAYRLSKLVDEVLDLSKLEQRQSEFVFSQHDICTLVEEAADSLKPLLQDKQLSIHFDHEHTPMMLTCDKEKITQVITNLLGNAIKFTPVGKSITLMSRTTTDPDGQERVCISIKDEGIGVPEEEKEIIFDSFKQSSRTDTGAGGTGLGLAICKHIVEAHDGHIWLENNQNTPGAVVFFHIPASLQQGKRIITL